MSDIAAASPAARPAVASREQAPLLDVFLTFLIIGATSFGGGVVAFLRNALVGNSDEWIRSLQ